MRTPEKGRPNFSNLSYSRLREYRDVVTEMIGSFSEFPEEKEVLKSVWKYLNEECADKSAEDFDSVSQIHKRPCVFKRTKKLNLDT